MKKLKLVGLYYTEQENEKDIIKQLKDYGFSVKPLGLMVDNVAIQIYLKVEGRTLKEIFYNLDRQLKKFRDWGILTWSLVKGEQTCLTEEQDYEKLRDLNELTDEEFLFSYSYLKKEDLKEYKDDLAHFKKHLGE